MKCNKVRKNLLFYVEGSLGEEESGRIAAHLLGCETCRFLADELNETLQIIGQEKVAAVNPFFYTRLKTKLTEQAIARQPKDSPFFVRILQPALLSALLILGIYSGFKIGKIPQNQISEQQLAQEQVIPFLNELSDEPIETFILK